MVNWIGLLLLLFHRFLLIVLCVCVCVCLIFSCVVAFWTFFCGYCCCEIFVNFVFIRNHTAYENEMLELPASCVIAFLAAAAFFLHSHAGQMAKFPIECRKRYERKSKRYFERKNK